ncbi:NUDIX domain-containing protein [Candidatus Palauibacter polyketidifaciens]|uniref:NUDIX domain-containing protein n=1 Tax=Candidatus Palauibacter polyketidifaciens TaxID=3056740 RepID=UPI00239997B5|nr:NUDIX domain-containing protein [Candidatus Palauibacter polyketidifaciens]MDE2720929.1 DNA mismatch repair protein MutT [Candidatus Palauibacter polyketidifaciens]
MTGDCGPNARPTRHAMALVIEDPESAGKTPRWLLVRRPDDDPDLPGVWGLPAGSHADGEADRALVRRIGREKLGVETEDLGRLSEGQLERPGYRLEMRLHAARIAAGEPRVPQSVPGVTQYSEWGWKPSVELRHGADRGSLCCRLALDVAAASGE